MARQTGRYRITSTMGEQVRAFVPNPLPPSVRVARELHALVGHPRSRILSHTTDRPSPRFACSSACPPIRWLPFPRASRLLGLTAPPARKAIEFLQDLGVLREVTGRQRGRVYAYHEYLETLIGDDG